MLSSFVLLNLFLFITVTKSANIRQRSLQSNNDNNIQDLVVEIADENKAQYLEQNFNTNSYKFGYEIGSDGQFHHENRGPDSVTYGCYGHIDPNKNLQATHYVADSHGYRVIEPNNPIIVYKEDKNNEISRQVRSWSESHFPKGCDGFKNTFNTGSGNEVGGVGQSNRPNPIALDVYGNTVVLDSNSSPDFDSKNLVNYNYSTYKVSSETKVNNIPTQKYNRTKIIYHSFNEKKPSVYDAEFNFTHSDSNKLTKNGIQQVEVGSNYFAENHIKTTNKKVMNHKQKNNILSILDDSEDDTGNIRKTYSNNVVVLTPQNFEKINENNKPKNVFIENYNAEDNKFDEKNLNGKQQINSNANSFLQNIQMIKNEEIIGTKYQISNNGKFELSKKNPSKVIWNNIQNNFNTKDTDLQSKIDFTSNTKKQKVDDSNSNGFKLIKTVDKNDFWNNDDFFSKKLTTKHTDNTQIVYDNKKDFSSFGQKIQKINTNRQNIVPWLTFDKKEQKINSLDKKVFNHNDKTSFKDINNSNNKVINSDKFENSNVYQSNKNFDKDNSKVSTVYQNNESGYHYANNNNNIQNEKANQENVNLDSIAKINEGLNGHVTNENSYLLTNKNKVIIENESKTTLGNDPITDKTKESISNQLINDKVLVSTENEKLLTEDNNKKNFNQNKITNFENTNKNTLENIDDKVIDGYNKITISPIVQINNLNQNEEDLNIKLNNKINNQVHLNHQDESHNNNLKEQKTNNYISHNQIIDNKEYLPSNYDNEDKTKISIIDKNELKKNIDQIDFNNKQEISSGIVTGLNKQLNSANLVSVENDKHETLSLSLNKDASVNMNSENIDQKTVKESLKKSDNKLFSTNAEQINNKLIDDVNTVKSSFSADSSVDKKDELFVDNLNKNYQSNNAAANVVDNKLNNNNFVYETNNIKLNEKNDKVISLNDNKDSLSEINQGTKVKAENLNLNDKKNSNENYSISVENGVLVFKNLQNIKQNVLDNINSNLDTKPIKGNFDDENISLKKDTYDFAITNQYLPQVYVDKKKLENTNFGNENSYTLVKNDSSDTKYVSKLESERSDEKQKQHYVIVSSSPSSIYLGNDVHLNSVIEKNSTINPFVEIVKTNNGDDVIQVVKNTVMKSENDNNLYLKENQNKQQEFIVNDKTKSSLFEKIKNDEKVTTIDKWFDSKKDHTGVQPPELHLTANIATNDEINNIKFNFNQEKAIKDKNYVNLKVVEVDSVDENYKLKEEQKNACNVLCMQQNYKYSNRSMLWNFLHEIINMKTNLTEFENIQRTVLLQPIILLPYCANNEDNFLKVLDFNSFQTIMKNETYAKIPYKCAKCSSNF